MKKKHKFLTILLIVVLCVTLLTTLIACDKTGDSAGEVKDSSEFISNGNFEVTSSDTFPKIPGSWSGSAGSTSSGNSTDIDEDSLVAGVIDTNRDVYEKNKKTWNRLANPGAVATNDSNILMIYNKKSNSYKYTSNNFSLDANKIFQIQISVKTVNLSDDSYGAYIKVGGDAFVEFGGIKTNGSWTTYTAMIKTSNISSNSLNVVLSNGKDGKNDGALSEGYAFFDNVVVTEVTDDTNGKTKEEKYNEFVNSADNDAQKGYDDVVLGDSSFKNISGTSNPYTARKWTGVSSSGSDGETAPTGSDYLERGVVDKNATNGIPSVATDISPRGKDSKMLMINNKQATAYGYRTDNKIKITRGDDQYYKLSVWVLTSAIEGNGAYIRLKTSTDKDEQIFSLDNINTNGEWSQISIIIKADVKRSKEIYLQLGLGTGGKNDTASLVKGVAFFDEITLTESNAEEYQTAEHEKRATSLVSTLNDTNLINSDVYSIDNYVAGQYDKNDGIPDSYRGTINIEDNIITINNNKPSITIFKYNRTFKILANNHYRLSFKVKTDIVNKDKGISVKLYQKVKNGTDTEVSSVSDFNISDVEETLIDNGYVEFAFLIQGDLKENKDIYFEIIMGSGTNLTPDTLVQGSVSLTDFEMFKVNYADYNSESTGNYVKRYSFKNEDTKITNAQFNQIDISATKTQYEKDGGTFNEENFLNGNNEGLFGLPQSWTNTSNDELKNLYAGIYNVNNSAQSGLLNVTDIKAGAPSDINFEGNNNFLAISALKKGQIDKPWGFTSPSISLSKGNYYKISVWAKLVSGTATINLLSSSKTVIESFEIPSTNTNWTQYFFYVNAGFDNSTVYLELKLGGNNDDVSANGTVFFDRPYYNDITYDEYDYELKQIDDSVKNKIATTFNTTTFDNATSNSDTAALDTPDGWSGSHADTDAPSGEGKSIAGVYNRDHGNRNWFGGKADDDSAENPAISAEDLINIMNTAPSINIADYSEVIEGASNNNVLVIHNNAASEYTYTTTLAENSLTQNKYYEISLFVLTYNVASDKTAKIQLKLHNSTYEFSKNDARGINVNTNGKWVRYSFFIATEDNADIDNVQLSVSLGTSGSDNYVSGYLFVDNVSISEIEKERYDNEVPEDKFPATTEDEANFEFDKNGISNVKHRIIFTSDDLNKEEETETENKVDPLLWLYITSGIIGGLIVIVVIIFLLKKFHVFDRFSKKGNFNEKGSETYNRNRVDANKANGNAQQRDINKKHQD